MGGSKIKSVRARRIWADRGHPALEVDVRLESGVLARGRSAGGRSVGELELPECRDGGSAFGGLGLDSAVAAVGNEISPALTGADAGDQQSIDALLERMNGPPGANRLGANVMLATSFAVLKAAARDRGTPLWHHLAGCEPRGLPLPQIKIYSGGSHADGLVSVQDFMVMCRGASTMGEALDWTAEVFRAAKQRLRRRGEAVAVAGGGGLWPPFSTSEAGIEELLEAICEAGLKPGAQVVLALDLAASGLYRDGRYALDGRRPGLDAEQLSETLVRWVRSYPLHSIEDPFGEHDWAAFRSFFGSVGDRCQVVADDLTATTPALIERLGAEESGSTVIVKPTQVGTVSGAARAVAAARSAGLLVTLAGRSGDTEDVITAGLAAGWEVDSIKVGGFAGSDRLAKYNELLRIAEELGDPPLASLALGGAPARMPDVQPAAAGGS